ncbi:lipopolysaccharide biosynthesis protein [Janthinobacterium sp. FW305-129]|uniref:GumC family protein n=1 Tax=Janthinobacterium sp. FW305-129 TaxID=2775054 RepID=UPI001E2939F9|nr:Wzz/FepE/Etk N-terminal domain-containing protein [Janthinobacterium sp. FW305-129]MCC7597480.1 lipopolysaccharide biosynthesis protein [Janthinobacterium sp. FW305-129]
MIEKTLVNESGQLPRGGAAMKADTNVNLLDLLIIIVKNKKKILFFTIIVMVITAGVTLLIPNKFTARAQVLPPQSQSSANALLGQLGSLGSLTGGSLKNPNDTYLGILNSRTMADSLIERFKLQQVYGVKFASDARLYLQSASKIMSSKENLISIEFTHTDPKLAAAVTNAYIEEMQKMTSTLAITEASRRRLFFEKQLEKTKADLVQAETALRAMQEKTGVIKLNEQAEGAIKAAATIKAMIAAKEIEIGTLRTFVTDKSAEFIRAQQELAGLRTQLSKIESGVNAGQGDSSLAVRAVPELGQEYTRIVREVKYQEALFEMFAKQFEFAKVDEAKEGSLIQVLDAAIVPEKKSKPSRAVLVLMAGVAAAILATLWAFLNEVRLYMKADPANAARYQSLREYAKWR